MNKEAKKGLVLKNFSGFYYVQDEDNGEVYACRLRGKIKQRILSGDRVIYTPLDGENGVLEELLDRDNELVRPRVANTSLLLIVLAQDQPCPDLTLLDRLLFHASYSGLKSCIVLNKSDLPGNEAVDALLSYYPGAGFTLIRTSTKAKSGLDELREHIRGEIAVMAGPSGSGKSSLLNELCNYYNARTGEVSLKIGRGKHTTRHVELYPLQDSGWIVDTPGFSVLDMPEMKRNELRLHFADFYPFEAECRFNNCLHYKEIECGVKEAAENGKILASRYKHYVSMLEEIIAKERCY